MNFYNVDCLEKIASRVSNLQKMITAEKEFKNLEEDILNVELNKTRIVEFCQRFKKIAVRVKELEDLYFLN